MLSPINTLAADASLSGWEIGGIVVAVVVAGVALWMLPEFLRYMKIRHM